MIGGCDLAGLTMTAKCQRCECRTSRPGAVCGTGATSTSPETLRDIDNATTTVTGNIAPLSDEDWFKFGGKDASAGACDNYHVSITLDGPAGQVFDVYAEGATSATVIALPRASTISTSTVSALARRPTPTRMTRRGSAPITQLGTMCGSTSFLILRGPALLIRSQCPMVINLRSRAGLVGVVFVLSGAMLGSCTTTEVTGVESDAVSAEEEPTTTNWRQQRLNASTPDSGTPGARIRCREFQQPRRSEFDGCRLDDGERDSGGATGRRACAGRFLHPCGGNDECY